MPQQALTERLWANTIDDIAGASWLASAYRRYPAASVLQQPGLGGLRHSNQNQAAAGTAENGISSSRSRALDLSALSGVDAVEQFDGD